MFKKFLVLFLSLVVLTACEEIEKPEVVLEKEVVDDEKEVVLSQGQIDTNLIKEYYAKIAEGKLREAYEMKTNQKESFNTFYDWYKNTKEAVAYGFEEVGDHKYEFSVDLVEANGKNERYRTVMDVVDGKLKTDSAYKIASNKSEAALDGLKAYVSKSSAEHTLYLDKNGKTVEVYSIDRKANLGEYTEFLDVYFLRNGDYLVGEMIGWESRKTVIFDVKAESLVHEVFFSSVYGFSRDGEYFYQCGESGMASGEVSIFNVGPKFTLKRDLVEQDALIYGCGDYDSQDNVYYYKLSWNGFDNPVEYGYDLDNDMVFKP